MCSASAELTAFLDRIRNSLVGRKCHRPDVRAAAPRAAVDRTRAGSSRRIDRAEIPATAQAARDSSAWAKRGQARLREALHPPEDADVVNIDAPLGQELFHVTAGESEAQIPAAQPR